MWADEEAAGQADGDEAGRTPEDAVEPAAEGAAEQAAEDVEQDLEAMQSPEARADEYLALAQRTQADFDNYRKRARQEVEVAGERGVARLAAELLGALDNFEHALAAVAERPEGDGVAEVARGFGLIRDELVAGLARCGVEADRPHGERFDPQFHEAIAHVPAEASEAGTVVEVHQPGYRIGSTVIRAARVSVAGG